MQAADNELVCSRIGTRTETDQPKPLQRSRFAAARWHELLQNSSIDASCYPCPTSLVQWQKVRFHSTY